MTLLENRKNVNTITFFNILSTLILQGLTFITAPIISRLLGVDNYGIASVYVTWVGLVSIIFGLQTQSTLAVARNEYSLVEQPKYQSGVLFLSILSYVILSAAVIIFINPISKVLNMSVLMIITLLLHSFGQFVITFINTKFTYEFKAKSNFFMTTGVALSTIILSLVLIYIIPSKNGFWGRILGLAIPYTVVGGICAVYIILSGKTLVSRKYWKFCIPLCLPIVLHNVSNLVLNQSDRVMIQGLMDNASVGVYSLAYSFGSVLSAIWSALNNSWLPFYYEYNRKKQYEIMLEKAKNYIELFTILTIGFVYLSVEVFHIFASDIYWGGTQLIPLFSIGFYFMFMYSFPVNYEFYNKKTKLIAVGTILSALINIFLNYIFIKKYGIYGAALATVISFGLQYIFHHICACKFIPSTNKYPFRLLFFAPYCFGFLLSIIIWYYIQDYILIRWVIAFILGSIELYRMVKRKSIF